MSSESIWDDFAIGNIKPLLIEKRLSEPVADDTAIEISGIAMNWIQNHLELG
jgi:hypothetical protein